MTRPTITRRDLQTLTARAFEARRVAGVAVGSLSALQIGHFRAGQRAGAAVNRALDLQATADEATAEARAAKVAHRAA
jgi:hypothetical protein